MRELSNTADRPMVYRLPENVTQQEAATYTALLNLAIAARMYLHAENKKDRRFGRWYLAQCLVALDKASGA